MMCARDDRPSGWRWHSACRRVTEGVYGSDGPADAATRLAARYIRELQSARSPSERRACERRIPTMAAAHALRVRDPEMRLAVESRLLAEVSSTTIAALASLDVRVVNLYALLFYDVADRLQCADFIRTRVIQVDGPTNDPEVMRGRAIRLLCWIIGPVAADYLLMPAGFREADSGRAPGLVESAEWLGVRSFTFRDVLLAAAARPFDTRAGQELTQMLTSLELADAQKPRATPNPGIELLKQIVDGLRKAMSSETPEYPKPYAGGPVEPNAAELLRLQRGLPVPELDAKIRWTNERVRHVEPLPDPDAAPVG